MSENTFSAELVKPLVDEYEIPVYWDTKKKIGLTLAINDLTFTSLNVTIGNPYTVVIDGIRYFTTAKMNPESSEEDTIALGNLDIADRWNETAVHDDTGEPFVIGIENNGFMFATVLEGESHKVTLYDGYMSNRMFLDNKGLSTFLERLRGLFGLKSKIQAARGAVDTYVLNISYEQSLGFDTDELVTDSSSYVGSATVGTAYVA